MKRYEKMSKEEIMEFFAKNAGECENCIVEKYCEHGDYTGLDCCESLVKYLSEEIPMKTVSRWQTIKSDDDFARMYKEQGQLCKNMSRCACCPYSKEASLYDDCEVAYFTEKIEVEED